MIEKDYMVALDRCESYDVDNIERVLRLQLDKLGVADMFKDKRVVIKPNLVMKKSPEAAATTHPAVLEAVIRILKESASDILIAESPGGLYTEQTLAGTYRGCGLTAVAERMNVPLNFDTSYQEVAAPNGKTSKVFNMITPIVNADVIVDLAKLKSHSLTGYSGAAKNYFGVIPGVQKFEMHARFPDYNDFGSMLADLVGTIIAMKPTFNVVDGIMAMEGNGPTGGEPRKLNCILSGLNPFSVDIAASSLIKVDSVIMLEEAKRRGLCPSGVDELKILSDEKLSDFTVDDFKKPDTASNPLRGGSMLKILPNMFGGKLNDWLQPRPLVDTAKCVGCGECVKSCPRNTIELKPAKAGKKQAFIIKSDCIRCYCCQELCPFKAVKIKKNPIIKLIGG